MRFMATQRVPSASPPACRHLLSGGARGSDPVGPCTSVVTPLVTQLAVADVLIEENALGLDFLLP